MIVIEISWAAVGAIVGAFGLMEAALGFYVRYLILQHQVNCPYPKAFADTLNKAIGRVIALEEKVDRHIEHNPDRERSFPGGL